MKLLLFLPTYNEARSAHNLAKQLRRDPRIAHTLIVDDSDDPTNSAYTTEINDINTTIIRRTRAGKWSAWRIALEKARGYDGLIQSDSDLIIKNPHLLISKLRTHDLVTAYQDVKIPTTADPISQRIGEVYRDAHLRLRAMRKFNMGGRFMALSRRVTGTLLDKGFFLEPVPADDHVIGLASAALGLRCRSIDCGVELTSPATLREWVRYRSRQRGVIEWSERYVASKIGEAERIREISRADIKLTTASFLASILRRTDPLNLLVLTILGISSLLPHEDRAEWTTLTTTKPVTPHKF